MTNKVQFGLANLHFATLTETDNKTIYGTPMMAPGAVSATATPNNTEVKFEADNDPNYYANYANDGYALELAMAVISDDFKVKFLGYKKDVNGLIAEDTRASSKPFALLFEVSGNSEVVRCVYYKCTAGRPSFSPKTGKEPEAQTIPITVGRPIDSDYSFAYCRRSENQAAFDAWFDKVQLFENAIGGDVV